MITKESVRKLMIEKQEFTNLRRSSDKDTIYSIIENLGCLQIDTINVVERAHYLTLWARIGNYEKILLDTLAYEDHRLFEYLAHAACFIPLQHFKYYIHAMHEREKELVPRLKRRTGKGRELIDHVLTRIRDEGPLASSDFDSEKRGKGGWWNRKDEKVAMDYLHAAGVLAVSHRENFQRYYDLAENVIPLQFYVDPPTDEERVWFFTAKTMDALGPIQPKEAREYYQHWSVKLDRTSSQLGELINEKETVNKVELEGSSSNYYCLQKDAARLEDIDDDFNFDEVRLIGYFDNFMWNRERIRDLFGFDSKLEIFLPPKDRVYGYYHLPILFGDKLVARVEPKMERNEDKLIVRGYWTEPGFSESEEYRDKFENNLDNFAAFNGAESIEWLC
jgi:uncharacterized protein YcaQ